MIALLAATVLAAEPTFAIHRYPMPMRCDSAIVADVDGDGDRDLVAVCRTRVVAVLLPEGTQRVLWDARDGGLITGILWDADRDGARDLVVGRISNPWVERRAGKGGAAPIGPDVSVGVLLAPDWRFTVCDALVNGVHGLAVGDIDGDGAPDLVVPSINGPGNDGGIAWHPAGQMTERRIVQQRGGGPRLHAVAVADLDGDGRGDIIAGTGDGSAWWRNPGASGPWTRTVIDRSPGGTEVVVADLDGDGRPDVAVASGHGVGIRWYTGGSGPAQVVDDAWRDVHALAAGDLDGDGDPDLAAASFSTRTVRWYRNDGPAGFVGFEIDQGQESYQALVTDVDGDGRNDIVVAGRQSNNVVVYRVR